MLDPKEKYKQNFEIEEKWLKIIQAFTYYSDGQISILKVKIIKIYQDSIKYMKSYFFS